MSNTLRIVFLFLLFLTAILFVLRKGPALSGSDLKEILLDFLLVPASLGTVVVFVLLITNSDPRQLLLQVTGRISRANVSFLTAIPEDLQEALTVKFVERHDTDGDDFDEWVVFYEFDRQDGQSPMQVSIYDNDRGVPPVIFPYRLVVPGREFLSERPRVVNFTLEEVTVDANGSQGQDLPEIIVSDLERLSVFRFNQNSESWDFPRDSPVRYDAIGFFIGPGGVAFDGNSKDVTVIDNDQFARNQLAARSVHELNPVTNTYWDNFDSTELAAPTVSTIDFYQTLPNDIFNTAYPEKIALAFYLSTCGGQDRTLCINEPNMSWEPQKFLSEDALVEYGNGNASYFGLNNFSNNRNIQVSLLKYFPDIEVATSRNVVTGSEARFNVVDITFTANSNPIETIRYQMGSVGGQWKILRRTQLDTLAQDSPAEINLSQ